MYNCILTKIKFIRLFTTSYQIHYIFYLIIFLIKNNKTNKNINKNLILNFFIKTNKNLLIFWKITHFVHSEKQNLFVLSDFCFVLKEKMYENTQYFVGAALLFRVNRFFKLSVFRVKRFSLYLVNTDQNSDLLFNLLTLQIFSIKWGIGFLRYTGSRKFVKFFIQVLYFSFCLAENYLNVYT